MSVTGLSSQEILLTNLNDHQVIRIDGTPEWMSETATAIQASHADSLTLNDALTLNSAQQKLAEFLVVENDASFIQQALKVRLAQSRRLILIIDSDEVETAALTYLMGLPAICDESSTAVVLILLTSPSLVRTLKSAPELTAKLDGYYQQEPETTVAKAMGGLKPLVATLAVITLGAGGWHLWQERSSAEVASQTEQNTRQVESEPVDRSTASEKPQIFAEQPAEPPVISPPVMTVNVEKAEVATTATISADQIKVASPQEEIEAVMNPKLLADLTATVEKARQKKQGSVTAEAQKSGSTIDRSEQIESVKTVTSVAVLQAQKATVKTEVELPLPQVSQEMVLVKSDSEKRNRDNVQRKSQFASEVEYTTTGDADHVIAEVAAESSKTEKPSLQKQAQKPTVAIVPLRAVKAASELQLPPKESVHPKPVVEKSKPPVKKSVAGINNEKAVRAVVNDWSIAWAAQDWDAYINSYLQNTQLYGVKMSIEEWRDFRKKRLLTPAWIKLKLGEPKYTRLNSHWYRVEFYQRFEKPGYADETTKILELTLTSSGWKIASEATDGTVVLKRPLG